MVYLHKNVGNICVAICPGFTKNIASLPGIHVAKTEIIIGKVGKELFYVKKSILVTFSVLIISLCEVKTR